MSKVSLTKQIAAGRQVLGRVKAFSYGEEIEHLFRTLEWMERNEHTLRLAAEISQNEAYQNVKAVFPDAKLVAIRDRASPVEED